MRTSLTGEADTLAGWKKLTASQWLSARYGTDAEHPMLYMQSGPDIDSGGAPRHARSGGGSRSPSKARRNHDFVDPWRGC